MKATVDFCGITHEVEEGATLVVGREGDIVIDDNPYLHRHFLSISVLPDIAWLHNLGTQMSATVSDSSGLTQTWLAPSARTPLVFPETVVWFTAGPTTYDMEISLDDAPVAPVPAITRLGEHTTIGALGLTPDQRRLVLSLAESVLRRGPGGKGQIPSSVHAARRLGWTVTKFNRKLDNVCGKLAAIGITGLVGETGSNASSRRVRLVEYAIASRLVTAEDLPLLDTAVSPSSR